MRWLGLLALSGCYLYFESPPPDPPPDPDPDPPQPTNVIARECIRAVAAGDLLLGGHAEIFLTWVCDAPGAGGIIETIYFDGTGLVGLGARADYQQPFVRTTVLDQERPAEVLCVNQYTPGGWVFAANGGFRYETTRPFTDVTIATLNPTSNTFLRRHLVYAGDSAIRAATDPFVPDEQELLTGKPFTRVAVAELGSDTGRDLFFVAGAPGDPLELGVALQTATSPLTYQLGPIAVEPAGDPLPLVTADVDGDGIRDVIGGASRLFVRSSKTGELAFLDEKPSALATGDVDGDGVADVVFVTADGTSIRRVEIATDGALSSLLLLAEHADSIAIADIDGDQVADIIAIRDLGTRESTLAVFRAALEP